MNRVIVVTLLALLSAAPARAAFPYPDHVAPGTVPGEIGCGSWKMAATPEPDTGCGANGNPALMAQNAAVRTDPQELGGIRGDATADISPDAKTAWNLTTGRPDVTIAVLDSGIKWNDAGAMGDLRRKVRLNTAELPLPQGCANYDCNGDGVVNVDDYAGDPRVDLNDPRRVGPAGVLTPQDLLIAFSDGTDADRNGFVDDIAGWDFVDNDNDPFDDVQYGHGTGEARDSTAEADNGGDVGTCPNCTVVPLRVGESFIADVNRFAQAVLYAADNHVTIVQEALGTLNNSTLARQAIDYAYAKGVTIVASAADEAAQHHNQPGVLPHVILVNSVTKYDDTFTPQPRSYLQFNGCTNFMSKVTVAVPSSSCSSEATGRGAGIVGLIYSEARSHGITLSPDEVRQLFQGTADDVDFADADLNCASGNPLCTDPNSNTISHRLDVSPVADTKPYAARRGYDQFYGYGRLNARAAVQAVADRAIPPGASIESPDWWTQLDPAEATIDVRGHVDGARLKDGYTCALLVAPGVQPDNGSRSYAAGAGGDFHAVPGAGGAFCDGSAAHTGDSGNVLLGSISTAQLKSWFPATTDFAGNENGGTAQTSNGRPNTEPYAFTARVIVVPKAAGEPRGEDRRTLYLHRDSQAIDGFPKWLTTDGASSPVFADLDGDNRNELVFATSDGTVHALRRDGSELPGWPAHGDLPPVHTGQPAFKSGTVPKPKGGAILGSVAIGDLDGDGVPEVVGADYDGRVYAWDAAGHRVWTRHSDERYSGKPLEPFVNERHGEADRTEHGFFASPVIADLDGDDKPEIVLPGADRHLYAWHGDGSPVSGFPFLVVDRSKVAAIDPDSEEVTFKPDAGALMQGKIVDTPALADITGDGRPEIVVGTNEEYEASKDGGLNAGNVNTTSLSVIGQAGILSYANSRVYAFQATGELVAGWPKKVGILNSELLPDVGEGITGSPVVADLTCASGGAGPKVGVIPDAGPGYVFNADGSSCYGQSGGQDNALSTDVSAGVGQVDHPVFPAVGLPAFGDLGGVQPAFVAPVAGLLRALDLVVPDYQVGGQDFTAAWEAGTGQMRPGFPAQQNDLSFLTGPSVGDIDGLPGEEILAGTASLDLQAFNALGQPASSAWPKLTGDWTVATPLLGPFGDSAHKTVVSLTRLGGVFAYETAAPACSPSSSPRFHHDAANSGDYARDAVAPGRPSGARLTGSLLAFEAPGDDLLCGTADHYETLVSTKPVTGRETNWAKSAVKPAAAGAAQAVPIPGSGRYVAVRAVDEQGNRGRPAVVSR
jgi:hypothetical protein